MRKNLKAKGLKMGMAALCAALFLLSGCSKEGAANDLTQAEIKQTEEEEEKEKGTKAREEGKNQTEAEASKDGQEGAGLEAPQVTLETRMEQRYSEDGKTCLVEGSLDTVSVEAENYEALSKAVEQWSMQKEEGFPGLMDEYAGIAAEDAKTRVTDFYSYSIGWEVEVTRADSQFLSLKCLSSDYLGGAHGNYAYLGAVFDSQSGKKLSLTDLAEDKEAFRKKGLSLTLDYLKDKKDELELFDDYEESVKEFWSEDRENWYLKEDNLIIVFNPYEIAPYASGAVEISLSMEQVSGK